MGTFLPQGAKELVRISESSNYRTSNDRMDFVGI